MRMPLPPPPAEALIITGIADLVGDLHGVLVVVDDAEMARHGRDLGRGGGLLGLDLVAHRGDGFGIGPDEDDRRPSASASGKRLALGEKAVARMHRLGAGRLAGLDDLVDQQIALRRGRRADRHRLVGHLDVQRVAVGLGIDRDRLDAHPARRLDDPAGDFAAVGDQDALEHACSVPRSRDPLSSSVASLMLPAAKRPAMAFQIRVISLEYQRLNAGSACSLYVRAFDCPVRARGARCAAKFITASSARQFG